MHSAHTTPPTPSTPRNKMTRKTSLSMFPLTPPQSSHSTNRLQTYTPPHSPIFSDPRTSTLTPASTPPRSMASPFNTPETAIPFSINRFPCTLTPDPSLSNYYNNKSGNDEHCRINNDLLRVAALMAHGTGTSNSEFFDRALSLVDDSLARATAYELWDTVSKCHLYRTYCLMNLRRWKEARLAVVKAATIRAWGHQIQSIMRDMDEQEEKEMLEKLRLLSADESGSARKMSFDVCVHW